MVKVEPASMTKNDVPPHVPSASHTSTGYIPAVRVSPQTWLGRVILAEKVPALVTVTVPVNTSSAPNLILSISLPALKPQPCMLMVSPASPADGSSLMVAIPDPSGGRIFNPICTYLVSEVPASSISISRS